MKQQGADGLKIIAVDRDQLEAILDEAHTLGLRTTTHIGVEETTAKDYIELGVNSIEHFYGIADAALDGVQRFPPEHELRRRSPSLRPRRRAVGAGRSRASSVTSST